MRLFRIFAAWRQDIKIGDQPQAVPDEFVQSETVSKMIARRIVERNRKHAKIASKKNAALVSDILTDNMKPLDYKLTKGTRDELGRIIVLALANKMR